VYIYRERGFRAKESVQYFGIVLRPGMAFLLLGVQNKSGFWEHGVMAFKNELRTR
jgi:hypothetical protein